MTFLTENLADGARFAADRPEPGPVLAETHWGYTIGDGDAPEGFGLLARAAWRFLGAIMLMVALGLWVLPDSVHSPDLLAMKLGAMAVFSVAGGALFWAGRAVQQREIQFDTTRGEVRVGRHDLRGAFRLTCLLKFEQVASVYMMRAKAPGQPARLFLRLPGEAGAIEVARGTEAGLEPLRLRLARDLARSPRQPAGQPGFRRAEMPA